MIWIMKFLQHIYFYPRPPRGGRPDLTGFPRSNVLFLSTPSARRATVAFTNMLGSADISIHALREEGDSFVSSRLSSPTIFLSTPSGRRATENPAYTSIILTISIHALREEGDIVVFAFCIVDANFYPRPPGGGRRAASFGYPPRSPISIHALREEGDVPLGTGTYLYKAFLSTPSGRRATLVTLSTCSYTSHFYPRPPGGGRRATGHWHLLI